MVICCIVGCSNQSSKSSVRFFSIPKVRLNECERTFDLSLKRRVLWISRINRQDLKEKDITASTRVCSNHFISGSPSYLMHETDPDWAPSLNLGYNFVSTAEVENAGQRHQRFVNRHSRRVLQVVSENAAPLPGDPPPVVEQAPKFVDASTQTDLTVHTVNIYEGIALLSIFREEALKDDDYRVKYYTGVPTFALLQDVFGHVSDFIKIREDAALTKFQEFCLVLVRLRLNLQEEDLAYRFCIDQSTVSRIIDRWLPVMAHTLQCLIIWPDRETLQKTMPECFQEAFGKTITVIIDCFEIRCERPSSLLPRAQTFSSYKHHNTVKILIGATPQGTICFSSLCWGGRTSDKHLTENCGFLDRLVPGDVILADRGFDISDSVGFLRARVLVPAFKGVGRSQLSSDEVEVTREIAHVRIHVERVIGLVRRKYTVLQSNLHYSWSQCAKGQAVTRIDQALIVCCALTNLSPPIVPMTELEPDVEMD